MSGWHSGPRYQAWKIQVHERWGYRCHLCGHAGARDADLLTPISILPNQPYDPMLARPAHGVYSKCAICKVACNQVRGNKLLNIDEQYERVLD